MTPRSDLGGLARFGLGAAAGAIVVARPGLASLCLALALAALAEVAAWAIGVRR